MHGADYLSESPTNDLVHSDYALRSLHYYANAATISLGLSVFSLLVHNHPRDYHFWGDFTSEGGLNCDAHAKAHWLVSKLCVLVCSHSVCVPLTPPFFSSVPHHDLHCLHLPPPSQCPPSSSSSSSAPFSLPLPSSPSTSATCTSTQPHLGSPSPSLKFKLAIYTVNDDPDFPFTFTYDAYDTRGSQNAALAGAIKLLSNSSTIGLIGTGYSSALEAPAMYSSLRSKPMVSPGSTSIAATTKSQFPCLLRSISSDAAQIKFLAATLAKLSISNVAVLTPDDSYGRSLLPQIVSYYATANIRQHPPTSTSERHPPTRPPKPPPPSAPSSQSLSRSPP